MQFKQTIGGQIYFEKDICEVDKYISIVDDESCCLIDIQIAVKPEKKEPFLNGDYFIRALGWE